MGIFFYKTVAQHRELLDFLFYTGIAVRPVDSTWRALTMITVRTLCRVSGGYGNRCRAEDMTCMPKGCMQANA